MEKRPSRVSGAQWELLLDYLEKNPTLARGYNNTAQGRRESHRLWEIIANLLNAQGSGVTKTPKEWSVYVSNFKSKLKKIVSTINADASGTGGGPPQGSSLSEYDSRFLAILGPGFGQAAPGVRVDPFPNQIQIEPQRSVLEEEQCPPEELNVAVEMEVLTSPVRVVSPALFDLEHPETVAPPAADENIPTPPLLPRRRRERRVRSRPLAPLDEACRVLQEVEMQRAAADAARAQALGLIGTNLGRLADAAEVTGRNLGRLADVAETLLNHFVGSE